MVNTNPQYKVVENYIVESDSSEWTMIVYHTKLGRLVFSS